jgi:hypothetical protein
LKLPRKKSPNPRSKPRPRAVFIQDTSASNSGPQPEQAGNQQCRDTQDMVRHCTSRLRLNQLSVVDAVDASFGLSRCTGYCGVGAAMGRLFVESMKPEDILVRGRDPIDRGLCFICLTANISRQFEFVQGGWMNDPSFNKPHNDVDPLLGKRGRWSGAGPGTFTFPALPVRMRVHGLQNFLEVRGGAYFLPGKAALQYLAQC